MDTKELWNIPNQWAWTQLKAIGDIVAGGTPSTKEPSYWGTNVNWISPADLTGYTAKTISNGAKSLSVRGLQSSSAKIMPAGSVHFSSRAPIGYVAISSEPLATNQGFKSLVPANGIFNEYVYYYLKGSKQLAEKRASGTTFLELSGTAFGQLPFPLPPSNEQRRIVAKIEELFSELDKGVESLKTARAQLKTYRQAVLKHAFEGKLTADWREKNKDKLEPAEKLLKRIKKEREACYQQQLTEWKHAVMNWEDGSKEGKKPGKPNKPKDAGLITKEEAKTLSALPREWIWRKLGEVTTKITDGEHFRPPVQESGIFFLSAKDVRENGVSFENPLYISKGTSQKARLRCDPDKGDILIVSRGATVGRMCIVDTNKVFCLLGSVILIKVAKNIESNYLLHSLKSPSTNRKIISASGSTAQQAIYLRDIQHVAIPLCSEREQKVLAQILDEKLSIIDQMSLEIDRGLQKPEPLRQSILKKSFSGQLVAQDPNDDPASVSLERIKIEKMAQDASKKLAKTKPKKRTKRKSAA